MNIHKTGDSHFFIDKTLAQDGSVHKLVEVCIEVIANVNNVTTITQTSK